MARKTKTQRQAELAAAVAEREALALEIANEAPETPEETAWGDAIEASETPAEAEGDDETPAKRSVVPKRWQQEYARRPLKGTCSDPLAYALAELTNGLKGDQLKGAVAEIASWNGIDAATRWGHLNPGMQRMNLGNCLRGMAKNNKPVVLTPSTAQAA
jgi:hypothetical protein